MMMTTPSLLAQTREHFNSTDLLEGRCIIRAAQLRRQDTSSPSRISSATRTVRRKRISGQPWPRLGQSQLVLVSRASSSCSGREEEWGQPESTWFSRHFRRDTEVEAPPPIARIRRSAGDRERWRSGSESLVAGGRRRSPATGEKDSAFPGMQQLGHGMPGLGVVDVLLHSLHDSQLLAASLLSSFLATAMLLTCAIVVAGALQRVYSLLCSPARREKSPARLLIRPQMLAASAVLLITSASGALLIHEARRSISSGALSSALIFFWARQLAPLAMLLSTAAAILHAMRSPGWLWGVLNPLGFSWDERYGGGATIALPSADHAPNQAQGGEKPKPCAAPSAREGELSPSSTSAQDKHGQAGSRGSVVGDQVWPGSQAMPRWVQVLCWLGLQQQATSSSTKGVASPGEKHSTRPVGGNRAMTTSPGDTPGPVKPPLHDSPQASAAAAAGDKEGSSNGVKGGGEKEEGKREAKHAAEGLKVELESTVPRFVDSTDSSGVVEESLPWWPPVEALAVPYDSRAHCAAQMLWHETVFSPPLSWRSFRADRVMQFYRLWLQGCGPLTVGGEGTRNAFFQAAVNLGIAACAARGAKRPVRGLTPGDVPHFLACLAAALGIPPDAALKMLLVAVAKKVRFLLEQAWVNIDQVSDDTFLVELNDLSHILQVLPLPVGSAEMRNIANKVRSIIPREDGERIRDVYHLRVDKQTSEIIHTALGLSSHGVET